MISSAEVEIVCNMLAHLYYASIERDPCKSIVEKIELLNRPKPPTQNPTVFKKQFFDLNPASKLKKGLQRVTAHCLEELQKRVPTRCLVENAPETPIPIGPLELATPKLQDWIQPRLLSLLTNILQEYPSFLGFYGSSDETTSRGSEDPLSSPSKSHTTSRMSKMDQESVLLSSASKPPSVILQMVREEGHWKVSGIEAKSRIALATLTRTQQLNELDELSAELLLTLLDPTANFRGSDSNDLWVEYFLLGGDVVEKQRLRSFFEYVRSVQEAKTDHLTAVDMFSELPAQNSTFEIPSKSRQTFLDRCDTSKHQGLDLNCLTVMFSLLAGFYDHDFSGRLIAEGAIPSADESDRLLTITKQLKQYEQISKTACVASLLMDSPIWYFGNIQPLLRVYTEEFVFHQSINVSAHFSKDQCLKTEIGPQFCSFELSHLKAVTLCRATLEEYIGTSYEPWERLVQILHQQSDNGATNNLGRNNDVHTPMALSTDGLSQDGFTEERIIFNWTMRNELYEYVILNLLVALETSNYQTELLGLIDKCYQNCRSIKSDMDGLITEVSKSVSWEPNPTEFFDEVKSYQEMKSPLFLAFIQTQSRETSGLHSKLSELLDGLYTYNPIHKTDVFKNASFKSFRCDYLMLIYEVKYNDWDISQLRFVQTCNRFATLDACLSYQPPKMIKCSEYSFYLNGMQLSLGNYSAEIEILKNEYYLKMARKLLGLVFLSMDEASLTTDVLAVLGIAHQPRQNLQTNASGFSDEHKLAKAETRIMMLSELLSQIEKLVDLNPTTMEFFSNFGQGEERLFSMQNCLAGVLEYSTTPDCQRLFQRYCGSAELHTYHQMLEETDNFRTRNLLIEGMSKVLHHTTEVIRKSMLALYVVHEKGKIKYKDAHHFLRATEVVRRYTNHYYHNRRTSTAFEKFNLHLCEEYFLKNIDVSYCLVYSKSELINKRFPLQTKATLKVVQFGLVCQLRVWFCSE